MPFETEALLKAHVHCHNTAVPSESASNSYEGLNVVAGAMHLCRNRADIHCHHPAPPLDSEYSESPVPAVELPQVPCNAKKSVPNLQDVLQSKSLFCSA